MSTVLALLGTVVAGMIVQACFTFRQTSAFSAAVRDLRRHGYVAVGGGGRRYRGGKAFVAIAADDTGHVTKAISLTGWTTFARPSELSCVKGISLARLERDDPITSVDVRSRSALQGAARSLREHLAKAAT